MQLIRNPKDFYAGLLFIAFGVAALILSRDYAVGSAARMGAGYFPRALGILLVALGALLSFGGFRASEEAQPVWHWRPLCIVLFSIGVFVFAAQWLGLVLAGLILVFMSSTASGEFNWKEALVSGVIQGIAAVAIFVYGLAMPLPVWPFFISGAQ